MSRRRSGRFSPIEMNPDYAVARSLNICRQDLREANEENRRLNRRIESLRAQLRTFNLDAAGGRRTRGKLRAKSRAKSRKKRRKSRRKSKGRKRRRKNRKKRTKRRR